MRDPEFNEPEFLALLRAGDPEAFRRLIRRLHGSLVGTASGIIGSRAQAEEVVQDAWLAVFSGIGRFEGRSSLISWVFTIVLNRARTRATREGRLVALSDGSEGNERAVPLDRFAPDGHWQEAPRLWDELDPERVVSGRQLWVHVQDAIERLPAGQKAVIILRDVEGEDAESACTLLGITAENQRVLLHRARGRIRAAVEGLMTTAAPAGTTQAAAPRPKRAGGTLMRIIAWACRAGLPAKEVSGGGVIVCLPGHAAHQFA